MVLCSVVKAELLYDAYRSARVATIGLTHKLTVVTHNTRELARVEGLKLQDWET